MVFSAESAFCCAGLKWEDYVSIGKRFYHPAEVFLLQGGYSKGYKKLGWAPKVKFEELVKMMVESDRNLQSYK